MAPDTLPDPLRVALAAVAVLDQLGVAYATAGSLASSLHGEPRSTDAIDVVADLRPIHAGRLVRALRPEWYVSEEKLDVFVVGSDRFDAERVATARPVQIGPAPDALLRVDTAEHTVLRKLEWFRRGGETSERQWRDVLGVLRAQRARLDRQELARWADLLGVSDLLQRALTEAER